MEEPIPILNNNVTQRDLMHFQEEMLNNLHRMESAVRENLVQANKDFNKKVEPYERKFEDISQKLNDISNTITADRTDSKKIEKLEQFKSKAENLFPIFDSKIVQNTRDISNATYKYDKMLLDNLLVPGIIGNGCKFPNLRAYIENSIIQFSSLNTFKDKYAIDLKSYKVKLDGIINTVTKQVESVKQSFLDYCKKSINELQMKFDERLNATDEKIQRLRIENGEYAIELKKQSKEIGLEWEKIKQLKDEVFERFDEESKNFKKLNQDVVDSFDENKKEFKLIKKKFTELSEFIKDVRFRKNLGIDSKKKEIMELSKNINFRIKQKYIESEEEDENDNNDELNRSNISQQFAPKKKKVNQKQETQKLQKNNSNLQKTSKTLNKLSVKVEEKKDDLSINLSKGNNNSIDKYSNQNDKSNKSKQKKSKENKISDVNLMSDNKTNKIDKKESDDKKNKDIPIKVDQKANDDNNKNININKNNEDKINNIDNKINDDDNKISNEYKIIKIEKKESINNKEDIDKKEEKNIDVNEKEEKTIEINKTETKNNEDIINKIENKEDEDKQIKIEEKKDDNKEDKKATNITPPKDEDKSKINNINSQIQREESQLQNPNKKSSLKIHHLHKIPPQNDFHSSGEENNEDNSISNDNSISQNEEAKRQRALSIQISEKEKEKISIEKELDDPKEIPALYKTSNKYHIQEKRQIRKKQLINESHTLTKLPVRKNQEDIKFDQTYNRVITISPSNNQSYLKRILTPAQRNYFLFNQKNKANANSSIIPEIVEKISNTEKRITTLERNTNKQLNDIIHQISQIVTQQNRDAQRFKHEYSCYGGFKVTNILQTNNKFSLNPSNSNQNIAKQKTIPVLPAPANNPAQTTTQQTKVKTKSLFKISTINNKSKDMKEENNRNCFSPFDILMTNQPKFTPSDQSNVFLNNIEPYLIKQFEKDTNEYEG